MSFEPRGFSSHVQMAPILLEPGTMTDVALPARADFRRRVMDSLRRLVPASGAFFCFNAPDALGPANASRMIDGALVALRGPGACTLAQAFGFHEGTLVARARYAYCASELVSPEARAPLPYFRDNSISGGFVDAALVFLHERGVLLAVCGVERRGDELPFRDSDTQRLEYLAPLAVAGASAQLAHDELLNGVATSAPEPEDEELSPREREVARLLVAGYTVVNTAAIMGIGESTVRTYVRRLYRKLAVTNRADLVRELVGPERTSAARFAYANA
ncbi:LuxR C-terminal-related transcriptional regulator [Pendulispora albinea]|uniref:LuxR C-terminal-related transcriptional regulator n=1 Tax=Pendulispora albinea TaxID=2741071 RepID=A0ABZ2LWQ8_9BACT